MRVAIRDTRRVFMFGFREGFWAVRALCLMNVSAFFNRGLQVMGLCRLYKSSLGCSETGADDPRPAV